MLAPDDEGVLDPWVEQWQRDNPQPDWMKEGFPPDIRELARNYEGPPPTRHLDDVRDDAVGDVAIRIYRNNGPQTGVVVYFHGGAFIVGGVKMMDNVAREIAHATGAVVISVEYRLAPENPFPAGLDDCEAVTRWVQEHVGDFGTSTDAIVLAGESAGANLATAVTLRLRDAGLSNVAGQVLIYPCTDGPGVHYPSREQFGTAEWVWDEYRGGQNIADNPYAVPMRAASLAGLPPTLVVLAGCDSLRDEGRAYAARLRADGVDVEETCFAGQPHGFVNHDFPAAASVHELVGTWVRTKLAATAT